MIQFCTRDSARHLTVAKHPGQFLVAHLGQGRIHHENQPHGNGDVGGAHLEPVDGVAYAGKKIAAHYTGKHCQEDPQREESV